MSKNKFCSSILKRYGKSIQTRNGKAKAEEYFLKFTTTGRKINEKNVKLTDIEIWNAVSKYKKECKKNKIEQQYIKHGDTFFNKAILDYIEHENDKSKEESKRQYKEVKMSEEEYKQKMDKGGKNYGWWGNRKSNIILYDF